MTKSFQPIDVNLLISQVNDEIASRLLIEAESARHIHRRGFKVGGINLLIPLEGASEVLVTPRLFRLPGAPHGVAGLANRQGRVVPVVDLQELCNTSAERAPCPWLLVCGRGDEAVGILISSLPERKKFDPNCQIDLVQIKPFSVIHAKGAYLDGEEYWVDLDSDRLFHFIFNIAPEVFRLNSEDKQL